MFRWSIFSTGNSNCFRSQAYALWYLSFVTVLYSAWGTPRKIRLRCAACFSKPLPYLWRKSAIFPTLFMTDTLFMIVAAGRVGLNKIYERLLISYLWPKRLKKPFGIQHTFIGRIREYSHECIYCWLAVIIIIIVIIFYYYYYNYHYHNHYPYHYHQ